MALTVTALQQGSSLNEAKAHAKVSMGGAMRVLIKTILAMYNNLSSRTLHLMREIKDRQKAEARLKLAANVFDNTLDAICIMDSNFNIIEANPVFMQTHKLYISKLKTLSFKNMFSRSYTSEFIEELCAEATSKGHWEGEIVTYKPGHSKETDWLTLSCITDNDNVSNYVAVFSNVSQLLQKQQNLEHLAQHDNLTGLPNRMLLEDRLGLAINSAKRNREILAVCYLDLDGFKPVNDTYGHDAGDVVLCEVAKRFKMLMRSNDTVARIGGDEFVFLLNNVRSAENCRVFLNRLLAQVRVPIKIKGAEVVVSASIGVTLYPNHGGTIKELLKQADTAMYKAKTSGKNQIAEFSKKSPR